jgi:hypothetical protein
VLVHDDIKIPYDVFGRARWHTSAVNVERGDVVAGYCRLETPLLVPCRGI